jgi:DNA-binding MarR family transcriptional regulator
LPSRAKPEAPADPVSTSLKGPLADSIFFRLVRAVNLTAQPFVESVGRPHDLSLNEWRVMLVLANKPRLSASEIGVMTGMDKMSVSRAVARLLRSHRVIRGAQAHDKRSQWLELSASGRTLFALIAPLGQQREAQMLSVLSSVQRRQLRELLDRILANPTL